MNTKTIQNLQQRFLNKVCTIFTKPVNRSFDEVHWREHFCVRIEEITVDGIWGSHPYNGTMSFFFMDDVVFIQEEIELDPNNPDHVKMIKEFEEQSGQKVVSDISPHLTPTVPENPVLDQEPIETSETAFVDIEMLKQLAAQTKLHSSLGSTNSSSGLLS